MFKSPRTSCRQFSAWPLLIALLATPASAAVSVENFFQTPSVGDVALSPDGRTLAMTVPDKDKRMQLATLDLNSMKAQVVASIEEADIRRFVWVNERRLAFNLDDYQQAAGDLDAAPGMYAVNSDGSSFRPLVERVRHFFQDGNRPELLPWNTFLYTGKGLRVDDEVLALKPLVISEKKIDYLVLQRIDTRHGRAHDIEAPPHTVRWLFDDHDVLRVVVTEDDRTSRLLYRASGDSPWKILSEFDPYIGQGIDPVFLTADGKLYVNARNGHDHSALYLLDPATGKFADQPVVSSERFDIDAEPVKRGHTLLGFRYTLEHETTLWLDTGMRTRQASIDKALPGSVNTLSVAPRGDGRFMLVHAHSATQPGNYYLFDSQEKRLVRVGNVLPGIDAKAMNPTRMVSYPARDGLDIPAYLTVPAGAGKNLPMVLLVHGGPNVRGSDGGWNPEVQFLASRGYAVLQPEFRGSTGFGFKHFQAGWKQWGHAMQDDLADGVKWAIAQGIADPKRVCIAGASYGGYATLMGLARDPDLYRCGIDWAGVTDINLMYDVNWSDMSDAWKRYGMPVLIGDRTADAQLLKEASPLLHAEQIRAPLLMAYGGMDQRVPLVHGEKFLDAVKAHNRQVDWVVYDREGHGWRTLESNVDFWTRVEAFLARQIGTP